MGAVYPTICQVVKADDLQAHKLATSQMQRDIGSDKLSACPT